MNKKIELLKEAVRCYKKNHVSGDKNEKVLIDFIDEIEQLILPVVGVTLPTITERELEIKKIIDKDFEEFETISKIDYTLGFRKCYRWIKQTIEEKGNECV